VLWSPGDENEPPPLTLLFALETIQAQACYFWGRSVRPIKWGINPG